MIETRNDDWHFYPKWYYLFPIFLFPIACIVFGYLTFINPDYHGSGSLFQIIIILAIIMMMMIIWLSVYESRVLRKVYPLPRLTENLWEASYQILIESLDEHLKGAEKVSHRWFDSIESKSYSPEVDTPFRYRIPGKKDAWVALRIYFSRESIELFVSRSGRHLLNKIDVAVNAGCSKMEPTSM